MFSSLQIFFIGEKKFICEILKEDEDYFQCTNMFELRDEKTNGDFITYLIWQRMQPESVVAILKRDITFVGFPDIGTTETYLEHVDKIIERYKDHVESIDLSTH